MVTQAVNHKLDILVHNQVIQAVNLGTQVILVVNQDILHSLHILVYHNKVLQDIHRVVIPVELQLVIQMVRVILVAIQVELLQVIQVLQLVIKMVEQLDIHKEEEEEELWVLLHHNQVIFFLEKKKF